jgi:hypothetical protein
MNSTRISFLKHTLMHTSSHTCMHNRAEVTIDSFENSSGAVRNASDFEDGPLRILAQTNAQSISR